MSPTHLLGRLGGEEFALIAPGSDETQADELGEACCRAVAAVDLGPAAPGFGMTVSVGVAHLSEGAADLDALLREADDRLFEAKRNGRNRVRRISRIPRESP
jgi:diguanylate cyclase (GGDEF)-like protein